MKEAVQTRKLELEQRMENLQCNFDFNNNNDAHKKMIIKAKEPKMFYKTLQS